MLLEIAKLNEKAFGLQHKPTNNERTDNCRGREI